MNMNEADIRRMNQVLRHRLRNFSSGIRTTMSFLSKELKPRLNPAEAEYFPLVIAECDGLTEMTNRMNLLFEEFAFGGSCALGSVLDKTLQRLRTRHPAAAVVIDVEPSATSVNVSREAGVCTILEEIAANAIEAAPGREAVLSACLNDGELRLRVMDNGPGLTESEFEQALLPFQTTKPRHLGVGLTCALRLAQAMDGIVRAEKPDKGGFWVELILPAVDTQDGGVAYGRGTK
jgi:signal transduction histidine kinase